MLHMLDAPGSSPLGARTHVVLAALVLPLALGAQAAPATKAATPPAPATAVPAHLPAKTPLRGVLQRPASATQPLVIPCEGKLNPAGPAVFPVGEALLFDLDVMGVRAGTLLLEVEDQGTGRLAFSASARSNTFFENVRKVTGKATSFTRDDSLRPLRYREDATEDGVKKWAEVVFEPTRDEVDIRYAIGGRERRVRYPVSGGPHDLLSLLYYVRTLDLTPGLAVCADMYGNRKIWRVRGKVEGEEWVSTPAGKFKTWHLEGTAQRLDYPSYTKEVHIWFTQDERRMPVAAVGEIDLGPVRALLAQIGRERTRANAPDYGGGKW